jgi:hypothetical protein
MKRAAFTTDKRCLVSYYFVIPAKAGTQSVRRLTPHWIPAFARMTDIEGTSASRPETDAGTAL